MIELVYIDDGRRRYNSSHQNLVNDFAYFGGRRVRWRMDVWQALCLLTTWIPFRRIKGVKTDYVSNFFTEEKNLGQFLEEKVKPRHGDQDLDQDWSDQEARLRAVANGSPKLRFLAELFDQIMYVGHEKLLIWVGLPAQQVYLVAAIREMGFSTAAYHSSLDQPARRKLTQNFHNDRHGVRVLVCNYALNSCGINMHSHFCNVVIFEPASSRPVEI